MKIGIAGTGRMGAAMAARLLDEGFEVALWNRTPEKANDLVATGAVLCPTPRALVENVDVVITTLTDAAALEAVYSGENGLLSADLGSTLFIEMSTVRPQKQQALEGLVRAKGGVFVECPVGGTTKPAREGKLFGFVGGEVENVARAMPVLEKLCRRIEHVGPVGAGSSMKLAINLPLVVFWQAFGEAMALCDHLQISPARLVDIFSDTSGGPNVLKTRAAAIAQAMNGDLVPGTFDIDSMRKDIRTMIEEADALGRRIPVTAEALACYEEASAKVPGGCDGANQSVFWARRNAPKGE
jgi:3-hydroxyisobutyrate dehydrogenase